MTRYDASLNGVSISTISQDLVVLDVIEVSPDISVKAETRTTGDGMRVVRKTRNKAVVIVEFAIFDQNIERRKEICQLVQKWAYAGGTLKINDRVGQQLAVECTEIPAVTSALRWAEKFRVVFTAFDNPFWESVSPAQITATEETNIIIPGNADKSKAEITATNTTDAVITAFFIDTEISRLEFSGISIPALGKILIGYDDNGYLYAKIGNNSVLGKRTVESSDDLFVKCGKSTLSFSSGFEIRLSSRGAWL